MGSVVAVFQPKKSPAVLNTQQKSTKRLPFVKKNGSEPSCISPVALDSCAAPSGSSASHRVVRSLDLSQEFSATPEISHLFVDEPLNQIYCYFLAQMSNR